VSDEAAIHDDETARQVMQAMEEEAGWDLSKVSLERFRWAWNTIAIDRRLPPPERRDAFLVALAEGQLQ
jgi:hypothetical protein